MSLLFFAPKCKLFVSVGNVNCMFIFLNVDQTLMKYSNFPNYLFSAQFIVFKSNIKKPKQTLNKYRVELKPTAVFLIQDSKKVVILQHLFHILMPQLPYCYCVFVCLFSA